MARSDEKALAFAFFLTSIFATIFLFFVSFTFPWISGNSLMYCESGYARVEIWYDGRGILEYGFDSLTTKIEFSCPSITIFVAVYVLLFILYIGLVGRAFVSAKTTKDKLSSAGLYIILMGFLFLMLGLGFFLLYRSFPIHGIDGVGNVGDLEGYIRGLIGCELVFVGMGIGSTDIILAGGVNIFLGIMTVYYSSKLEEKEKEEGSRREAYVWEEEIIIYEEYYRK